MNSSPPTAVLLLPFLAKIFHSLCATLLLVLFISKKKVKNARIVAAKFNFSFNFFFLLFSYQPAYLFLSFVVYMDGTVRHVLYSNALFWFFLFFSFFPFSPFSSFYLRFICRSTYIYGFGVVPCHFNLLVLLITSLHYRNRVVVVASSYFSLR